ncbi:MAG: hypothetical protein QGF90_18045 [Gammaproteobacteria bacterium]|jgi:hypothetical protein|nr:hypothetical protein [Gammaproteobacteria bacterium]
MSSLDINHSPMEFALAVVSHVAALLALTLIDLPLLVLSMLALFIGISLWHYSLGAMPGSDSRVRSILIRSTDCVLRYRTRSLAVSLPRAEYYSEFLLVLEFRVSDSDSGRCIRLNLLPDSLSEDDDRCLRRLLRFDCHN